MYEIFEELMEKKGYKNATQISNLTGIPRSMFTDWKKGRSTPKADKLKILADFFGVDVSMFFEGVQNIGQQKQYYSDETYEMAQAIFDNPDLHALMKAARGCDPEQIRSVADMLMKFKGTNANG